MNYTIIIPIPDFIRLAAFFQLMTIAGVDFGKAFDIHGNLQGSTFFAAVVLKVKTLTIIFCIL